MLTIEHTEASGTLLHGTSRGDGAAEVVKALGWRWGRSVDAWFVPRSRDVPPKRALIANTERALRDAGFEVSVTVDATPADRAELELRLAERAQERAAGLSARAERHQSHAEQRDASARKITENIPFGQPILLGHHSQRRAERDAARVRAHLEASAEHQAIANESARAAREAAAATGARHSPVTVANRIERLAADVRRDERALAPLEANGDTTAHGQILRERLAAARADLEHWQGVRAQQIAAGVATDYNRDSVSLGDAVRIRGRWCKVVRANRKTVSVASEYSWTDSTPWHEVQAHRPAAQSSSSTAS